MLSSESGRKRMGVYLEDWDPCYGLTEEISASVSASAGSDAAAAPLVEELVPRPLRPRTDSTSTTLRMHSPPLSPASTVFVSLQIIPPGKAVSGSVSLHRYRKSLSESRSDMITPPPSRSLKRKPKAFNLNDGCMHRTPPSPPPSPPLSSAPSSPLSLPRSSSSRYSDRPARDDLEEVAYSPPESFETPNPLAVELEAVCSVKSVLETQNQRPDPIVVGANSPDPYIPKLNAFCFRLRHFPTRVFSSHKQTLDTTTSRSRLKFLHHKGVQFEILSPSSHQHSRSCISFSNPYPSNPHPSSPYPSSPHPSNFHPSHIRSEDMETPHRPRAQSRIRSLSVDGGRQRTPSRTLFDDLETAHSSITSRFAPGNEHTMTSPNRKDVSNDVTDFAENGDPSSTSITQSSQQSIAFHDHPFVVGPDIDEANLPEFQSPLSLRIREWSTWGQMAAFQAYANFEKQKSALTHRMAANWPFKPVQQRNRRRKLTKLVKQQRGRSNGYQASETFHPRTSSRNSASSASGTNPIRQQASFIGVQGRLNEQNATSNPVNGRLNMFEMRRRNALGLTVQNMEAGDGKENPDAANEKLHKDTVGGESGVEGQAHGPGEFAGIRPLSIQANQAQVDIDELGLRDADRPETGASSPNFSRPMTPGKWFASRRRSPFKPLSHSKRIGKVATGVQGAAGATHSTQEVQHESERTILKLLAHQSESVNREIERGLFLDKPLASSDNFITDEEPIDLGPGSSQSSSIQHFSQYTGSSSFLPSPLRLASSSSAQFSEPKTVYPSLKSGLGSRWSTTRRVGVLNNRKRHTFVAPNKHAELLESEAIQEDDAEHDWETVAGSQQFTSRVNDISRDNISRNDIIQNDIIQNDISRDIGRENTEGSLADFSSFGSLANSRDKGKQPMRSSKAVLPRTSGENPYTAQVPAYADPDRHSHYFHQDPSTGQYVLLANANYRHSDGARTNAFSRPVPALVASTSRCPTPLPNRYRHPSPLGDPHTNPFCSTPPSLHGQPGQGQGLTGDGNGLSTVGDSKSNISENIENNYNSHRNYGQMRRDISENARASFQHWLSEVIVKDPAERSSQGSSSYLRHHYNSNFRNIGIFNSQNSSSNNQATSTDNNASADPLSVDINNHPCFRGYPRVSQLPSHSELPRVDSTAPSRSLSTDRLLPAPPGINKHAPGSLYLSIRSARDRVLGNVQKGKAVDNSVSETTQSSLQNASSAGRPVSTAAIDGQIPRQETGRSSIFNTTRSTLFRTPTVTRRSSTRQSSKTPTADELLRQRLEQLDPAHLARFCLPSPNFKSSRATWEPRLLPAENNLSAAVRTQPATDGPSTSARTGTNIGGVIDEEAALPTIAEASFEQDSNAFPDTPQLIPVQRRRSIRVNLTRQRRLGRQIILWGSLFVPLGWIVVASIGFGATGFSEYIMQWRSGGAVDVFHKKEELLARRLSIAYAVSLFIVAMVIVAVCISV